MSKLKVLDTLPRRVFVIGDIHGCASELERLIEYLRDKEGLSTEDRLIFIGDYIDRGPDSFSVVEGLIELKEAYPETIFLKGNHEDMLLAFLGFGGLMGLGYLYNGGDKTLRSYRLLKCKTPQDVVEKFPEEHLEFFKNLVPYVAVGDFICAHAGLNPIRALDDQVEEDLFWIRDEFIMNIHRFGKTVVFGHTPFEDVLFNLPFKVGIDTGLVYGNRLSCIELVEKKLYQVKSGSRHVVKGEFPG